MLRIEIKFVGVDSVGAPVDRGEVFEGEDLHRVFRAAEYFWFAQRALIAGPDIPDPEGGKRE